MQGQRRVAQARLRVANGTGAQRLPPMQWCRGRTAPRKTCPSAQKSCWVPYETTWYCEMARIHFFCVLMTPNDAYTMGNTSSTYGTFTQKDRRRALQAFGKGAFLKGARRFPPSPSPSPSPPPPPPRLARGVGVRNAQEMEAALQAAAQAAADARAAADAAAAAQERVRRLERQQRR